MRSTWRLLGLLKPFFGWVLLSVLLTTATIASGIGLLGTSAYLIARAALQPSIALLQVAIVGVRFFGISRGIFRYLERLTAHSVNFRLLAGLRIWLFRTIEPLAPAKLQDFSSGDLLNRIVTDVDTVENFYVRVVAPYTAAGLTIVGIGLFIGQFDLQLGLTLAAGMLISGFVVPAAAYSMGINTGRTIVKLRARLSAHLVSAIQGMSDLTAFNRGADASQQLIGYACQLAREQNRQVWANAWINAGNGLIANITMAAVLWLAIPLVTAGRLEGFMLPVVTLLALASFEAVVPLAAAAQHHSASLESMRRLLELENISPSVCAPDQPLSLPQPPFDLELRKVSFQYESDADPALKDISIRVSPGKKVAVIGRSGAGKTSLANILLRLWDYGSGEILLNSMDLRRFDPAAIRSQFSVISQSTYLFSATLRQNLRLAKPGAADDLILLKLQQAGLTEWVATLPHGLDTWVGEHGLRLSGGERQRVAIARALLHDTPLVILDEPTANLDALTEADINNQLQTALAEKTVLWITHRLVGLEWMDEIIVLDNGRIAEQGTHIALIKSGGLYARLIELHKQTIPLTFSLPPSS